MNPIVTTPFKSKHDLPFFTRRWYIDPNWFEFRIGTVTGLWHYDKSIPAYCILAFKNENPGNGHFDDMFEWFSQSCIREKAPLIIQDIMNVRLYKHLVEKRGFVPYCAGDEVIKYFKPTV